MITQLPQNDIIQLRSIKKTAIFLLTLIRLGQPATAKDLANILDIDYQTTRKHLSSLHTLGLATETITGWIASTNAFHLSTGKLEPVDNAIISRSNPLFNNSSTATSHIPLLEEEEEEDIKRDNIALRLDQRIDQIENQVDNGGDNRVWNALCEFENQGLHLDHKLLDLIEANEYITSKYIDHHADRLRKEKKFSNGLLIKVIKDHDPVSSDWSRSQNKFRYK